MNSGLSLYIHIPFCKSKCIYCDFFSQPDHFMYFDDYVSALCSEIKFYCENISSKKLNTVYIGGGTPSLLSISQLEKILKQITDSFEIDFSKFEGTIELNPDDINEKILDFINESILTRISLGIQSCNDSTLKKMNRRADKETCRKALSLIKEKFKKRLSLDLISGFPGENFEGLKNSIDFVTSYNPEHVSLYSLCVEEGTVLFEKIEKGQLDFDSDASDELWIKGKEYLESKGFTQYEVSNFCKNEKAQSRHNLVYWHLENYLGIGAGAAGSIYFKNTSSVRYNNLCDIKKYIDFWKNLNDFKAGSDFLKEYDFVKKYPDAPVQVEVLDKKTEEFEYCMMNLRLCKGISRNDFEDRFNKSIEEKLKSNNGIFFQWLKNGRALIKETDGDIFYSLSSEGLLYLNSFLEELMD